MPYMQQQIASEDNPERSVFVWNNELIDKKIFTKYHFHYYYGDDGGGDDGDGDDDGVYYFLD